MSKPQQFCKGKCKKKCSSPLIFLSLYQLPEIVINSSIKIELTTPPTKEARRACYHQIAQIAWIKQLGIYYKKNIFRVKRYELASLYIVA